MPRADIGEISLHYLRSGPADRPPVLLIAGMASDSASWQPILPGLAEHHDVIVPDNRCTGQTLPNPVASSRELMVKDLIGLLDALELERVTVIGHSMGAMLGWSLAVQYPERVSALVAMSAMPEVTPVRVDYFQTMARLRADSDPADWTRLLLHALFSPAFLSQKTQVDAAVAGALGYAHRQSTEAFAVQAAALDSFKAPLAIDAVRCPVLALTGELDTLATPAMLEARYRDIRQVQLARIPDAAHPVHWEQPTRVIETIQGFFDTLSA